MKFAAPHSARLAKTKLDNFAAWHDKGRETHFSVTDATRIQMLLAAPAETAISVSPSVDMYAVYLATVTTKPNQPEML